jgi:uncharacterized protein DUF4153
MRSVEKSFWPERPGPRATSRTLVILVAYGLGFDLAFNGQLPGISFPLFVAALAIGLRFAGPSDVTTDILLGSAAALSIFPAIRAAEGLIAIDVAAVGTLLALAVLRPERVAETTAAAFARAALGFVRGAFGVFGFLVAPFGRLARRLGAERWRPALRAAVIAIPIVAFFALLLGSADPVFADIVVPSLPNWSFLPFVSHVALTVFGTLAVAVPWRAAIATERVLSGEDSPARAQVSFTEWATALGALNVLFAVFVVVQFAFLFGGSNRVEVTKGLTYAEYARSGFVQLIITGGLVSGIVLAAWDFGSRSTQREVRTFRWLAGTMVGLCGVILVSALQRLALYEDAFGFTAKRFAGYAIIVFIAGVLGILLWTLLKDRRRRVVPAVLVAALLVVVAVNMLNPVRFIADQNARRFRSTHKIDAFYLATLGPDAAPVIATLLPSLSGQDAEVMRASLCLQAETRENDPGWRSWNGARSAAWAAIDRTPLTPAACSAARDAPLSPS